MSSKALLVVVLVSSVVLSTAANADDPPSEMANCQSYELSATERIAACTAVIEQEKPNAVSLSMALDRRGWAKFERADYESAAADFDKSLADVTGIVGGVNAWIIKSRIQALAGDTGATADEIIPYGDAFLGRSTIALVQGRIDEAIANANAAADWFVSPAMDSFALLSRAEAHRVAGDDTAAEADYIESLKDDPKNAYSQYFWAVQLFGQDRSEEGLQQLRQSVKNGASYGYNTLWLYLRSPDHEGEGKAALKQFLNDKSGADWPVSVARYYLGEMDLDALMQATKADLPAKERENLCEAHYYIAELAMLAGDRDTARRHYEEVMKNKVEWFVEYVAARSALAKF